MVTSVQLFSEGFTLGISTGLTCLATCGPVYSAYLMQQNRSFFRYVTSVLEMSLGRFIMYMIVGAIAGLIGTQISELQREYFTVTAYILFSVFLLVSVFRSNTCESGCKLPKWNRFTEWPILLGFLTGINICPSFLLAFSRSFVLSGPVAGMAFFSAFFIGTSIFLIPISFVGMFGRRKLFRSIARISAVFIAGWFILSALRTAYGIVSPYFDTRPVINLLDDTPAYVFITDTSQLRHFTEKLALNRNGKVYITDSLPICKAQHYLFTDFFQYGKDTAAFRRSERFVTVIDEKYLSSPDSLNSAIDFMKQYFFRFNEKKGDIFFLR